MKLRYSRPYINPAPVPKMPPGLVELMEGLSREVIKNNPSDIYNFCADHMNKLLELRDGRPPRKCLDLEQKINVEKNIIKQRAEQKRVNYNKNMRMSIPQNNLTNNKLHGKSITESEYHHVDKNNEAAESNPVQSDEKFKSEDFKCGGTVIITSEMEIVDEKLKENVISQAEVEECYINVSEVTSNENIEGAGSVKSTNIESNINILPDSNKNIIVLTAADVNHPKDSNKIEVSKLEDTCIFTNIPDKKLHNDFENNKDLGNKFNHEVYVRPNSGSKIDTEIDEVKNFEVTSNNADISAISNTGKWTKTVEEINVNKEREMFHGKVLDIKHDEYIDTTSISVDNNLINDNLKENVLCNKEIIETNIELKIVNEKECIALPNMEEGLEMININTVYNETTHGDTSIDELKSNNLNTLITNNEGVNDITGIDRYHDIVKSDETIKNNLIVHFNDKEEHNVSITEPGDGDVLSEEAPKINGMIQYNEKLQNTTVTDQADDCVPGEEGLKNNVILQCNEIEYNKTVTEQADGYVPKDEAPKINVTVQCETHNIEEDNEKKNQYKEYNIIEESKKSDLPSTNTIFNLKINEEKSEAPTELSTENIEIIVGSNSSLTNKDEKLHDNVTIKKQLNEEHITNANEIKQDLRDEVIISNFQNIDCTDIKKNNSQNDIDVEHYSTNYEYNNNNNKEELTTTDTNNVNPMDLERAAITIQKVFRNFLFRSKTSSFDDSGKIEFNVFERDVETKNDNAFANHNQSLSKERRAVGINRMDTVLQTVNEEKSLSLSTDDSSTISSAATVIQAHIRGFLIRNRLNRDKTISNASLAESDDSSATFLEGDSDLNKNKTVLNIHIVPEGGQFISRDESLLTSVELSLDGSPPTSANLHPLGYDKNERRKQLKREDAVQSISPPSNNSRLSEEHDSVKDMFINDKKTQMEQAVTVEEHSDSKINEVTSDEPIIPKEIEVEHSKNKSSESVELLKCKASENSTDELDVVTPFKPNEEKNSDTNNIKLLHSGEFHDIVLPTKVSRSDTEVVSGE